MRSLASWAAAASCAATCLASCLVGSGSVRAEGEAPAVAVDQVGVRVLRRDEHDATLFWISAKARVTNATRRIQDATVAIQLLDAQQAEVTRISLAGDVPPGSSAILTRSEGISTTDWVRVTAWKAVGLRGRDAEEPEVVARDVAARREDGAETFLLEATLENKGSQTRVQFNFRVRAVDAEGYEIHVIRMNVGPADVIGGRLGPRESQKLSERWPLSAVPWSEIAGWSVQTLTYR